MTQRLYYQDCYLRDFRARVVSASEDGRRVYLDQTAFYPSSGGQPFDTGTLGGANVIDVVNEQENDEDNGEGERIAHVIDAPLSIAANSEIDASIHWSRRYDHMQQHTGQHLLSAVLEELYKIPTVSFHMGPEVSTIEIGTAALDAAKLDRAEERCAEIIAAANPVTISFDDAATATDLRKPSERTGTLRVISIGDVDRSACGGTHVRTTAEIGAVLIRKIEKIRGNLRLEFVCGLRALRSARSDFRTLQEISRRLSVPAGETPALVAAQIERVKTLEKSAQRLTTELAQLQGRELWASTVPGPNGLRVVTEQGAIDDAVRARAQAFVALGRAVFTVISQDPASILLVVSADSGLHAGERIKAVVVPAGGRGGGNAALAQGSLPSDVDLDSIARTLVPE